MKMLSIASRIILPSLLGVLPFSYGHSSSHTSSYSSPSNQGQTKCLLGWFNSLCSREGKPGAQGPIGPQGPMGPGVSPAYGAHEGGFNGEYVLPDAETFKTVTFNLENGTGIDDGVYFDAETGTFTVQSSGVWQIYGQYDLHSQDSLLTTNTNIEAAFLTNPSTFPSVKGMNTCLQMSHDTDGTAGTTIWGSHQTYVILQAGDSIGLFLKYRGLEKPVLDRGTVAIQIHKIANAPLCD